MEETPTKRTKSKLYRMNSLLILGEHQDNSLNPNIKRLQRYSMEEGISTRVRNYEELFSKPIKINTKDLAVMFFFPFNV